jgi:hypothetical protein
MHILRPRRGERQDRMKMELLCRMKMELPCRMKMELRCRKEI